MAEKKEGFLKRIFRFGKKKRDEEEEVDTSAADAAAEAEAKVAEEAAEKLAEDEARVAAELAAAEAEIARRKAEEEEQLKTEKAEAERLESERLAAEEEARLKAEQEAVEKAERERIAEEEAAAKAEQERIAAEEAAAKAAADAETDRVRLEQERAAAEKAAEDEAERLRLAQETAADEAERERLAKEAEDAKAKAEAEAEKAEREAAAEKARLEKEAEAENLKQKKAAEKAAEAAEKIVAEKAAQLEREEAEKHEAERLAAEQAEAQKQIADTKLDGVFDAPPETHTDHAEPTPAPFSDTPEPAPDPVESESDQPEKKKSWFSRLKDGLSKSSSNLTENITAVFTKKKLDEDTLQELEDILIQADLGVETAMNVTDKLASQRMGKDVTDEEVRELMASEIENVLEPVAAELELDLDRTPHVILVVGVNGSGKTTTIGKLSQKLYDAGFSTLLVAGDTFRAAAIEQLQIWGNRTQSPVVSRPLGSDSAGLAFDAYEQCVDEGRDVMLMDTAGRLQNKKELMDELEKIIRVLKKQDPTAPHTVLLTLDATTGQNALNQVDIFRDVSGVNGLVMTKLDGTARGGILVAISAKHKLPVYFLGVGETVDDLEPFEARDFARSIAGLEV